MFRFDPEISSAVPAGETPPSPASPAAGPLTAAELDLMQRYWRAANYLTVGQIYLQANPLLRRPLRPEDIKPRLLGHWGTSPGLSFIYLHINRLIRAHGFPAIFLAGPGHGGPAVVANVFLEGSYSEVYPEITHDEAGLLRLFRQFSTPGGIPSHVSVPTPGSIHEGGELGYVLTHAVGAVLDNPGLLAVAVVGDGEFETGPLAGSWKGVDFLHPQRDGAVLPILHLNGYKIASPTVDGRTPDDRLFEYFRGLGYAPRLVAGNDPGHMHQTMAAVLDDCWDALQRRRRAAPVWGLGGPHAGASTSGSRDLGALGPAPINDAGVEPWPLIILRSPKGWTGPKQWKGVPIEGTFRAHQVPLTAVKTDADQLAELETWMRSYRPDELFTPQGAPQPDLLAAAPRGDLRMGASPHANGGRILRPLELPAWRPQAVAVPSPATVKLESTRQFGRWLREVYRANASNANFLIFCPDELASNRLDDVLEVTPRRFVLPSISIDDHLGEAGRVFEVLSEHLCEGWLEGYLLTGRHGLFATYEAFAMVAASMIVQHTKWLEAALALPWRAPVASLNLLLTSTCWRNDHNGFSHQGPGLIDVMLSKRGTVARIYFPPDANCLLAIGTHCFETRNTVNLLVIDKQPQLQWLSPDEAVAHCRRGASVWSWAGTPGADTGECDVVLAACGDIPTLETVAAAWWLRHHVPELRVRMVNIMDLMCLFLPEAHPHGLQPDVFERLFTRSQHVIFAFHGYQRAVHEVIHGRPDPERFHVRGFREQGTTTTPFDMVVLNGMSRFDLASEALRRALPAGPRQTSLMAAAKAEQQAAVAYAREHFEDPPAIRDWVWTEPSP